MSEEYQDPSANTAQFQAFASRPAEEPAKRTPVGLLVGIVAAAVVVVVVVAYLVVS
jgi:hypothetical protein